MPQMSQVLRERTIGMLTAGMSTRAAAREFNVNFSTISRLQRHFREFGSPSKRNINYIFILICYAGTLKLFQISSIVTYTPLQPAYNMSSWPNPLTPSPSNLSHTLTSSHTHYQHISRHRHLPHCVQASSGNPTAQKTYIKHFSYRKLQTYLSPSIHSENPRTSCLQPGLIGSFTKQQTGH